MQRSRYSCAGSSSASRTRSDSGMPNPRASFCMVLIVGMWRPSSSSETKRIETSARRASASCDRSCARRRRRRTVAKASTKGSTVRGAGLIDKGCAPDGSGRMLHRKCYEFKS